VFVTVKVAAGAAVTENRRKQTNARGARLLIPMKWLGGTSFGTMEDLFLRAGEPEAAAGRHPGSPSLNQRVSMSLQSPLNKIRPHHPVWVTALREPKKGGPDQLAGAGKEGIAC